MKHIHKIAAGQGWGGVAAYQGNLNEFAVTCERDASITRVKEVLNTCWGRESEAKATAPLECWCDKVRFPRTRLSLGRGGKVR